MKNPIVECLEELFEKVEDGVLTKQEAVNRFCLLNEGNVYVPRFRITKRDKVERALGCGLSVNQIHLRYGVNKSYIYSIKRSLPPV